MSGKLAMGHPISCQTFPDLPDISKLARHFQTCQTFPNLPDISKLAMGGVCQQPLQRQKGFVAPATSNSDTVAATAEAARRVFTASAPGSAA
jgi:hypothetical protein